MPNPFCSVDCSCAKSYRSGVWGCPAICILFPSLRTPMQDSQTPSSILVDCGYMLLASKNPKCGIVYANLIMAPPAPPPPS